MSIVPVALAITGIVIVAPKVDPDTFSIGLVQLSPRSVFTGDSECVMKNVNCARALAITELYLWHQK